MDERNPFHGLDFHDYRVFTRKSIVLYIQLRAPINNGNSNLSDGHVTGTLQFVSQARLIGAFQ